MAQRALGLKVSVGFASEAGPRKQNEDFGGAVFGPELPPRRDAKVSRSLLESSRTRVIAKLFHRR